MNSFFWIEASCAAICLVCLVCFLLLALFLNKEKRRFVLPHTENSTRFAVLIPARNESAVIGASLSSLHRSDYPKDLYDTYVIVESMEDPTVKICEEFPNTHVFLRRDLTKRAKGYALDECMKDIFANGPHYDAFLIMDADNLVAKDFLSRMNDAYRAGYHAACGKRNNKDWNASAVSSSSALTFTIINLLQNKPKTARGMNVMVSGTGFFVRADVLRELGGWPFSTLTEDYEFSNYAMCNDLRTCYVDDAVYYDEQPLTLWQSIIQRSRWVRGYFTVWAKYRKTKKAYRKTHRKNKNMCAMRFGTVPLFALAFDYILYLLAVITFTVICAVQHSTLLCGFLIRLGACLGTLYLGLALLAALLLYMDRKAVDMRPINKIKTVLFHPIFLISYVVAAVRALFIGNKWEVIRHTMGEERTDL